MINEHKSLDLLTDMFANYRIADNKWKLAITRVIMQRRALVGLTTAVKQGNEKRISQSVAHINDEEGPFESKSLSNALKKIQVTVDPLAIEKVEDFLSYAPAQRSLQDLQKVDKIFTGAIPSFNKFTANQRAQLLLCINLEFHEKGKVIVKEGREPIYFYFILSGQCNVFKERSGVCYTINILNSGDSFSDLSKNGFLTTQRFATVQCAVDTTLLRVDKGKCLIR